MGECVICSRTTSGSLEFCMVHYREHKKDIKDKKPWVRALKNESQRERRKKNKERNDISLDSIVDREYDKRFDY